MKRKICALMLVAVLFAAIFPVTASADIGPKPSVVIDFYGISQHTYYVTLLSSERSTGPFSVLEDGVNNHYYEGDRDYAIFLKFLEYQDTDGYYFLQYFQNCTDTNQFKWTYFPPSSFKILIYFADSSSFAISGEAYDRYAFDSYYSVSMTESDIFSAISRDNTLTISATKTYDYRTEIISFIARIVLTIAAELLVALLFALREKKQLLFIAAVNIITQILLNAALNVIGFNCGGLIFIAAYVLLELLVFIIEAIIYSIYLGKFSQNPVPKWRSITYAFAANAVSFALGVWLYNIIPEIF